MWKARKPPASWAAASTVGWVAPQPTLDRRLIPNRLTRSAPRARWAASSPPYEPRTARHRVVGCAATHHTTLGPKPSDDHGLLAVCGMPAGAMFGVPTKADTIGVPTPVEMLYVVDTLDSTTPL